MTHLKIGIPSLKGSKGRNPPPLMGKKMQNRTLEIPDLNATKSSKSRLTPTNAQTHYSLFKQAKMYLQNRLFAYGQCTYIVPTCTHIVNRYLHCTMVLCTQVPTFYNGTLYLCACQCTYKPIAYGQKVRLLLCCTLELYSLEVRVHNRYHGHLSHFLFPPNEVAQQLKKKD